MSAGRQFITSGSPWEAMAGYSRAVVEGEWIFVSGTVGQDFKTLALPETARGQAELALNTIEAALAEAGATLMDVVRVRVYVPDRADVAEVSAVMRARVGSGTARPTNTTVCCPLAVEGAKVEIEVTAKRRSNT